MSIFANGGEIDFTEVDVSFGFRLGNVSVNLRTFEAEKLLEKVKGVLINIKS
jgi:hypothetical protein